VCKEEAIARICKRLRRLGIDSEDSIPPAYVAWRAGTTNRVVLPASQAGNRFLGSLKGLQIRAQVYVSGYRGVGDYGQFQRQHEDGVFSTYFCSLIWVPLEAEGDKYVYLRRFIYVRSVL